MQDQLHKTLKRLVSAAISSRFSKNRDPKKDCYDQVTDYLIAHGVRLVRFTSEAECLEDIRNLRLEAEQKFPPTDVYVPDQNCPPACYGCEAAREDGAFCEDWCSYFPYGSCLNWRAPKKDDKRSEVPIYTVDELVQKANEEYSGK